MDGTITVISTPGIGSTFTFHLPLEMLPAPSENYRDSAYSFMSTR